MFGGYGKLYYYNFNLSGGISAVMERNVCALQRGPPTSSSRTAALQDQISPEDQVANEEPSQSHAQSAQAGIFRPTLLSHLAAATALFP